MCIRFEKPILFIHFGEITILLEEYITFSLKSRDQKSRATNITSVLNTTFHTFHLTLQYSKVIKKTI
jgi:hypothetical protein